MLYKEKRIRSHYISYYSTFLTRNQTRIYFNNMGYDSRIVGAFNMVVSAWR